MNENVRQKEGKAFRPWCEDEFISKVELPGIRQDQDWVGDPNAGFFSQSTHGQVENRKLLATVRAVYCV